MEKGRSTPLSGSFTGKRGITLPVSSVLTVRGTSTINVSLAPLHFTPQNTVRFAYAVFVRYILRGNKKGAGIALFVTPRRIYRTNITYESMYDEAVQM